MNHLRLLASVIASLLCIATCAAWEPDADTRTQAFDEAFRSIQVKVDGDDQALPIITLNGPERLTIEFDEIADSRSYLRYSLIHCSADWQPDDLVDSEFLDGFNQADVEQYAFSRATLVHYVHYTITIPDQQMRPLLSGNYLLRVYPEDDPDTTLLQVRFAVSEATMNVGTALTTRTDIDYNERHQQLSLVVDADRVPVRNLNSDLKVVVSQNGRLDNLVTLTTPVRVVGSKAYFEHLPQLIYPGGNEYRRMEIVSTRYPSMGVEGVERLGTTYHFFLAPDLPRAGEPYLYDQTQHGRFRIREYNSDNSDIEAEYADVHFSLVMPEQADGDIFIDGDLVYRMMDPTSRMVYNRATGAYELVLNLKQGAYNYEYLFVPHGSLRGSTARVEGDHCETVNEYVTRVYTRLPADRYDRLVAVGAVFSHY